MYLSINILCSMKQISKVTIQIFKKEAWMGPQWAQILHITFQMKQLMHIVGHKLITWNNPFYKIILVRTKCRFSYTINMQFLFSFKFNG